MNREKGFDKLSNKTLDKATDKLPSNITGRTSERSASSSMESSTAISMSSNRKHYLCVTDINELEDYLGDSKIVAFDYETAPDRPYRNSSNPAYKYAALNPAMSHIVGCSFSVKPHTAVYVPRAHLVGDNMDQSEFDSFLKDFLHRRDIVKAAHNIQFESMVSYHHYGAVIQPPVYDTMAASQLILSGPVRFRTMRESGLKLLSDEVLHEKRASFEDVVKAAGADHFDELNPHESVACEYGCADADDTLRLYLIFNRWFAAHLPKHRFIAEQIESPTAVYLGLMKDNGVPLDVELMKKKGEEAEEKVAKIRDDIAFMIGDVNIGKNASTKAFKEYIYGRPSKQFSDKPSDSGDNNSGGLGMPILKYTEKGEPSMDDATMIQLTEWCEEHNPGVADLFRKVQELRKWGKIQSTYITGYLKYLDPVTGKVHPDFHALDTDTGRFNCQKPNLQNCFDDQTEILTRRGFVLFKDLEDDDKVAQWDKGEISFVKPETSIERYYEGDMVSLKNKHTDLLLTPDHRCLLKSYKTGGYYVREAKDHPQGIAMMINAGHYQFGNIHLDDYEVILLVAAQADGNINVRGIDFVFNKARKYRRLVEALKKSGAPYSDRVKKSGAIYLRLKKSDLADKLIGLLTENKCWGAWLLDFDEDTVNRILEELYHWDGCFTIKNMYSSSDKVNADWMQILYTLTDRRAHFREYMSGTPNARVNYQVGYVDRNYSYSTDIERRTVTYQGMVYCVTVPSGFIVVRRGGQTVVSGNCPRKTNDPIGVRNFIKAPEGHLIVSLDFSQIELRVGAFYCRDKTMMDTYKNNGDIHAATTSVIFGCTYEEAQDKHRDGYKEQRTIAKNVNFGTCYGLFARGLQRTLKFKAGVEKTVPECQEIIDNIKRGYPRLTSWQAETKAKAERTMYSETWLGRRRYLPNIASNEWGKKSGAERMALNTPIQGTAADIIKLACGRILQGLPERPWLKPILQIHDELTFIIPEDKLDEAVSFVKQCMEVQPFPEFDLPLIAEAAAGPTFGTLEELD